MLLFDRLVQDKVESITRELTVEKYIQMDKKKANKENEFEEGKPNPPDIDDDEEEEMVEDNWIMNNKVELVKALALLALIILLVLVGWKISSSTSDLKKKKQKIKNYAKQMEKIIEGSENLVFVSWKDQQEGIGRVSGN